MKKFMIPLVIFVAIVGALALLFRKNIQELLTLREYVQTFEPESIDENFRSLYERESSIKIERAGPVAELNEAFRDDALPDTYLFESEERDIDEFLARSQTTGLAILHHGDLIYEMYDRGNSRESLAIQMSVSKSMASFLIGVAIEDGHIDSVDSLVTDYVPELKGTAYDDVTVRDVLEMSSGVRWVEDPGQLDSELVQSILAIRLGSIDEFTKGVPRENEPGAYNHYASVDTHVLGMVIRGATGMTYYDYFEQELWSELGAEGDAYILVDAAQEPVVFGGVNIRLRDMIRFGKLYIDGGQNQFGEQLVSSEWIKTSTTPDVPRLMPGLDNPESAHGFGYKYQWWIPFTPDGDDFSAIGIFGQFIYINPSRGVVIAKTSAYTDYTVDGELVNHETLIAFQEIARYLSPLESD